MAPPLILWTDGIHFVRPASVKDPRTMRFVTCAHQATASTYQRHSLTEAAAIDAGIAATKHWLKAHPADKAHRLAGARPAPRERVMPQRERKRVLPRFSSTRFDCVHANPVAQVWMCTSEPGDKGPVGRRKKGGRSATQTVMPHRKGECAVLIGREPVRTRDGAVRVFANRYVAEEEADLLYDQADPDTCISWRPGASLVAASYRLEVHFNPHAHGYKHPFIIWFPEHNRPIYVDTMRPTMKREGIRLTQIENNQLRMDTQAARKRARSEDRQPSLEERAKTFRCIWEAVDEMDRREAMLRGERV